jgi:hypothetical protein
LIGRAERIAPGGACRLALGRPGGKAAWTVLRITVLPAPRFQITLVLMVSLHFGLETAAMTSPNNNPFTPRPDNDSTRRMLLLMPHFEKISEQQRESVRILDAQQSLSSPLYRKIAEELGMEEYFKRYSTTRVR